MPNGERKIDGRKGEREAGKERTRHYNWSLAADYTFIKQ